MLARPPSTRSITVSTNSFFLLFQDLIPNLVSAFFLSLLDVSMCSSALSSVIYPKLSVPSALGPLRSGCSTNFHPVFRPLSQIHWPSLYRLPSPSIVLLPSSLVLVFDTASLNYFFYSTLHRPCRSWSWVRLLITHFWTRLRVVHRVWVWIDFILYRPHIFFLHFCNRCFILKWPLILFIFFLPCPVSSSYTKPANKIILTLAYLLVARWAPVPCAS
jgi:hypothetical protein